MVSGRDSVSARGVTRLFEQEHLVGNRSGKGRWKACMYIQQTDKHLHSFVATAVKSPVVKLPCASRKTVLVGAS